VHINDLTENEQIKKIPFTCTFNCGSRCALLAHIRDNEIIRIDTPTVGKDSITSPRLIPCVKGRARLRSVNDPERIKKPLKRIGPRGSGKFEEITWDKALDEITCMLKKTREEYGSESIFHATGTGSISAGRGFNGFLASSRFFSFWGAVTERTGSMSYHGVEVASKWMLGDVIQGSDRATLLDSNLIILWGNNPAETRMGPNTNYFIAEARDKGSRVILIDPRYTDSGVLADQWIPIKPGTDAALAAAMAYVMEKENLVDADFIEKYTVGYSDYRSYLLGEKDGIKKTQSWAEKITGVQEEKITQLAKNYAQIKPAALLAGWGPQRTEYGEQSARALITLACMSGNVGVRGGGFGGIGYRYKSIPLGALPRGPYKPITRVNSATWASTVLDNNLYPPIKMAYIVASNLINRCPDTERNIKALMQIDFIVCQDPYFTPTARYSDIVLPICTDFERTDLVGSWPQGSRLFYNRQLIKKLGESKTDYWVFSKLAERFGFYEEYTHGRNEKEWINFLLESSELDAKELKEKGLIRQDGEPEVALAKFRADPKKNPLNTQSGLIEINFSEAEKTGLPSIPSYIDLNKSSSEYPLQLITPTSRLRARSSLHTNAWLQRLEPHTVWINSGDASDREIINGEMVEVRSNVGRTRIIAMVTERIMPGVVSIYHGTWYQPAEDGVDKGGCANVLTSHRVTKTGGFATHSDWVEVKRLSE
jgi:anaerobic dimethyl sulfoxide reductase subunit A